jgi:YidC/Oxa1 family membrane protein insertase
MIAFFANIFGYLLNFLYNFIGNYGLAIILFSIIIKLIMLPISIKQQKTMDKNAKIQNELKQIQFKYKNDPEKLNVEIMDLYKREKMNPFGGCFSAIIQIILLFSVFYMVKEPLTYMEKVDADTINYYVSIVEEEELTTSKAYSEIAVINEADKIKEIVETKASEGNNDEEESKEIASLDDISINMDFLGIDLSKVPTQSLTDFRVYIIPVLYVISSFVSMKISTKMQTSMNKKEDKNGEEDKPEEEDPMVQANKTMSMMMPIMAISISFIAPLGLALYWLMNNILMIAEKLVLNKVLKNKEDEQNV